jgi:hypothetical protein
MRSAWIDVTVIAVIMVLGVTVATGVLLAMDPVVHRTAGILIVLIGALGLVFAAWLATSWDLSKR